MIPLVSVYITTHNRSERLIRAINSVLNQTYKNIEIIVSDDGSKDNTTAIVSDFMALHANIRYIRSEVARGANHARNKALKIAQGKFITGLDDDDVFMPNRVEYFVSHWDASYSFICDNFINSTPLGDKPYYKDSPPYIISLRQTLFFNSASNQVFTTTDRLRKIKGFNESLKKYQDWDCWLRMIAEYGPALRFNEKSYVMHHDQAVRVSNNFMHTEAYIILVTANIQLFNSIGNQFTNKYILKTAPKEWNDCFKCSSFLEFKKVIKAIIRIK
jgi:glycosyltransferase involved in cell wall biosynthesis